MRGRPFWLEDAPRPDDLVAEGDGPVPARVDALVVGSGVTGLNAARVLAGAGLSTAVVDAGPIGAGASTINGGMTIWGLKAHTEDVFRHHGPALGRELFDASQRSIDLVEEIVRDEGIDCALARSGAAGLGLRPGDAERFRTTSTWHQTNVGFPTRVLEGREVAEVVRSPRFTAALVDDFSGGLHPARYVWGLAAAARRAGATLHPARTADGIDSGDDGFAVTLRTRAGVERVTAGQVLVATNGYTGRRPVPELRRRIVPVGSYIVVTEPLDPELAESLIPGNRMLWTSRRFLNYFRRTPDDRILMGGRQDLSTDLDLHGSERFLRARITEFFPELADVAITHSWMGRLAVTFDLLPHIGRLDGVWYALGYSGHGVANGTYLGVEVARLMSGQAERSPFAEIAHPTRWFHRGDAWFLPAAAAWYRFLDRVGR